MERRQLMKMAALTAIGFTGANRLARAVTPTPYSVSVAISRNHGHALLLDLHRVVELIRQTADGSTITESIQGTSGHPHTISLNHEPLLDLLVDGSLTVTSSTEFGHAHEVRIELAS